MRSGEVALAVNQIGDGRVTTLGWYPTPIQASRLLHHLLAEAAIVQGPVLPPGVLALRRGPYRILLNFTEEDVSVPVDGSTS